METKYKDELELANSILTAKLDGTRYDIANNQEVKEACETTKKINKKRSQISSRRSREF